MVRGNCDEPTDDPVAEQTSYPCAPTFLTMKYHPKTSLYKHQKTALRRFIRQHHIGLLFEPGLGKTKVIVDASAALFLKNEVDRVLIFCPLSVVGVWEDEYATHCPVPYRIELIDRNTTKIPRTIRGKLQVIVVNYDLGWRRSAILDLLRPDMVVADESHRIKRASTRRSRYLRTWNKAPYRAILTGTPAPKSYLDIYGQWVFLNPNQFGTRIADFKHRYVRFGGYMNHKVVGYYHFNELKKKIRQDAIIRRKDQCLDLPPRTYQRVPVLLEDDAWTAYYKMALELFLELQDGEYSDAKNVAVKIMRLQQITGGWIKSDQENMHRISTVKMDTCRGLLEDLFEQDERVVIFARFRAEVVAICELGAQFRVPTYRLDGTVGRADRDTARRLFQTKPGPSLFVAQIQSGGLGITLHSSAEVIFYSVTYALDDYLQACDRVHRIGQDRPVRYQHLVAANTIDLDIYQSLQDKNDLMSTIMGSPKDRAKLVSSLAQSLNIDRT